MINFEKEFQGIVDYNELVQDVVIPAAAYDFLVQHALKRIMDGKISVIESKLKFQVAKNQLTNIYGLPEDEHPQVFTQAMVLIDHEAAKRNES